MDDQAHALSFSGLGEVYVEYSCGHIIMYKQYQLFLLKCNNTRSVSLSKYQYITHTQKQENVFALSRYTSLCTSRLIQ